MNPPATPATIHVRLLQGQERKLNELVEYYNRRPIGRITASDIVRSAIEVFYLEHKALIDAAGDDAS